MSSIRFPIQNATRHFDAISKNPRSHDGVRALCRDAALRAECLANFMASLEDSNVKKTEAEWAASLKSWRNSKEKKEVRQRLIAQLFVMLMEQAIRMAYNEQRAAFRRENGKVPERKPNYRPPQWRSKYTLDCG